MQLLGWLLASAGKNAGQSKVKTVPDFLHPEVEQFVNIQQWTFLCAGLIVAVLVIMLFFLKEDADANPATTSMPGV